MDSMQYRTLNATLDSCRQCLLSPLGGRTCRTLFPIQLNWLACSFYCRRHPSTLLRYADKHIVNIMKVYIERNNLQLELIRYSKQMLTLFTSTFVKRQIQYNITHWTQIRRFRTQTTSAPVLTVYSDSWRVNAWLVFQNCIVFY